MNGVIQLPRPTVTLLAMSAPHSDLATAFKMDRSDEQVLARPSRRLHVGTRLDGDIVAGGEQVQGA